MTSKLKVEQIAHTNNVSAMTISSGGVMTLPQIPCCQVRLTTANTQDSSDPYTITSTDIKFDSIVLNQGSCYSASTGRFTIPVAGIYAVECQFLSGTSTSTNHQISILKNGSAVAYGYNSVDNQHVELHAHQLIECAVNDYITVQLLQGTFYIDANGFFTSFTVRLVG